MCALRNYNLYFILPMILGQYRAPWTWPRRAQVPVVGSHASTAQIHGSPAVLQKTPRASPKYHSSSLTASPPPSPHLSSALGAAGAARQPGVRWVGAGAASLRRRWVGAARPSTKERAQARPTSDAGPQPRTALQLHWPLTASPHGSSNHAGSCAPARRRDAVPLSWGATSQCPVGTRFDAHRATVALPAGPAQHSAGAPTPIDIFV
jgi:hypothetical protein